MLGIAAKLQNRATQLSGGEMQRVAIGRALVRRPAVYLMDEPLSSLDAKLRADLRLELKHIQQDLGATILYVTHDQIEAMTMANRIGILSDGRLIQIGTPREIYESPRSLYVAARLGQPSHQPDPGGPPARWRRAGRHEDRRRAHRAFPDRQGDERQGAGEGRLGRASRRPEPPACQRRRAQAGDAGRSARPSFAPATR